MGRAAEALPILRRSLELVPPDYSIRPRLYAAIARAHESLGQKAEALAVCRAGREQYPDLEELLFLEASLLHAQGDEAGAEERLLRFLRLRRANISPRAMRDGGDTRPGTSWRRSTDARIAGGRRGAVAFGRGRGPRFAPAWQGLGARPGPLQVLTGLSFRARPGSRWRRQRHRASVVILGHDGGIVSDERQFQDAGRAFDRDEPALWRDIEPPETAASSVSQPIRCISAMPKSVYLPAPNPSGTPARAVREPPPP